MSTWTDSAPAWVCHHPTRVPGVSTSFVLTVGGFTADSGRYFSFPSFDTWQPDHPEEEQEPQMQMQMQMQSP